MSGWGEGDEEEQEEGEKEAAEGDVRSENNKNPILRIWGKYYSKLYTKYC